VNSVTLTPTQLSKVQWLDISSSLTSLLNAKQGLISNTTDLIVNTLNSISSTTLSYIDLTSSCQTQLNSKLSVSTASTTYQPLINGFSNLSTNNLSSGGILSCNALCENFNSINASSTNVYTLNYSTGSTFFIASSQQPSANFTVNLTNIPTTTTNQYTVTLIYQANFYPSLVSAVDTSSTSIVSSSAPKYIGGAVPTLTSSALYICTLTVLQMYSTKYIISSVSTYN
jgi:hypothetical protein